MTDQSVAARGKPQRALSCGLHITARRASVDEWLMRGVGCKPTPREIDHRPSKGLHMVDQTEAERITALEDTVNIIMGLMCDRGQLSLADIQAIQQSVDDRRRTGIRATPPGAGTVSAAVAAIILKAKKGLP